MPLAQTLQQVDRTFVRHRGRKLSYFGGCDYFRLASHPQVLRAMERGVRDFGLNVAASRSTTGNHILFAQLEDEIARFFDCEASVLVATGYATNLVVLQTIGEDHAHRLIDQRAHGSLRDAAYCAQGPHRDAHHANVTLHIYPHLDVGEVSKHAKALPSKARALLMTDGMFSHNGSAAPLRALLRALPSTATMLVDDAHGAGVLGKHGRGTVEHENVSRTRVVQTISLSKAFGCYGGAVLCSRKLRDEIIERSRLFNGNTPLPLPLANAALTAIRLLAKNAHWRGRMHDHAAKTKADLRKRGRDIPDFPGPIISITPHDDADAKRISARLLRHGVYPSLIRYAGSPSYFRFMISSEHTRPQLKALVQALEV